MSKGVPEGRPECQPGVRCDLTAGCTMARHHEPPCRVEEALRCEACGAWPWEACRMVVCAGTDAPRVVPDPPPPGAQQPRDPSGPTPICIYDEQGALGAPKDE